MDASRVRGPWGVGRGATGDGLGSLAHCPPHPSPLALRPTAYAPRPTAHASLAPRTLVVAQADLPDEEPDREEDDGDGGRQEW